MVAIGFALFFSNFRQKQFFMDTKRCCCAQLQPLFVGVCFMVLGFWNTHPVMLNGRHRIEPGNLLDSVLAIDFLLCISDAHHNGKEDLDNLGSGRLFYLLLTMQIK
jgi:hypothetical protein